MDKDKFIEVGTYKEDFNNITNVKMPLNTIYQSKGLNIHMMKSKHNNCLPYLDRIGEIIENPDYIGKNPNVDDSIELIKVFDQNILIGIKLNVDENYIYVSTMHDVPESKIQRRLHSGRLKVYNNK